MEGMEGKSKLDASLRRMELREVTSSWVIWRGEAGELVSMRQSLGHFIHQGTSCAMQQWYGWMEEGMEEGRRHGGGAKAWMSDEWHEGMLKAWRSGEAAMPPPISPYPMYPSPHSEAMRRAGYPPPSGLGGNREAKSIE